MTMKHYNILLVRDRSAFSTKWVCDFASNLVKSGQKVTLLCDTTKQKKDIIINPKVVKTNLSAKTNNILLNLWKSFCLHFTLPNFRFSRAIKKIKPDIIICYFLQDLFRVAFLQKHNVPIILMMHNPPNEVFEKQFKHWWKRLIFKHLIKKVSVIQVLMPEFIEMVKKEFPDKKVALIPNQVEIPEESKDYSHETSTIIHVAQIAQAKHQRDLIEAFIPLAKDFPEWKIKFFGKVKNSKKHIKYMQQLQKLVKNNNLEQQVIFSGFSYNITAEYLNSEIVAFPSYTEGFGYGLADGLALGLPGIGYDFALAVNHILVNEKSGYLVADKAEMTEKIRILMSDRELRKKMGKFARHDMERYSPNIIISQWLELIENILMDKTK